jgi:hypothetical protein
MEKGPSEWRWINVLYECEMNVCMFKKNEKKKKSGILPPNLNILVKGRDQLETITAICE